MSDNQFKSIIAGLYIISFILGAILVRVFMIGGAL